MQGGGITAYMSVVHVEDSFLSWIGAGTSWGAEEARRFIQFNRFPDMPIALPGIR